MKTKLLGFMTIGVCFSYAQQYVVPPSDSTRQHVPVISDKAMEECVKLYNEANWLQGELDKRVVDRYSQEAVAEYNDDVKKHSIMIDTFNDDCAGKQSQSAYEATQKLNASKLN